MGSGWEAEGGQSKWPCRELGRVRMHCPQYELKTCSSYNVLFKVHALGICFYTQKSRSYRNALLYAQPSYLTCTVFTPQLPTSWGVLRPCVCVCVIYVHTKYMYWRYMNWRPLATRIQAPLCKVPDAACIL